MLYKLIDKLFDLLQRSNKIVVVVTKSIKDTNDVISISTFLDVTHKFRYDNWHKFVYQHMAYPDESVGVITTYYKEYMEWIQELQTVGLTLKQIGNEGSIFVLVSKEDSAE